MQKKEVGGQIYIIYTNNKLKTLINGYKWLKTGSFKRVHLPNL